MVMLGFGFSLMLETLQLIFMVGALMWMTCSSIPLALPWISGYRFRPVGPGQHKTQEVDEVKQIGDKVSYVRNLCKGQLLLPGLAVLSLGLGAGSMYLSVARAGQGGLNTGAFGFASIAAAFMGMWFGLLSFTEKERNYILAKLVSVSAWCR